MICIFDLVFESCSIDIKLEVKCIVEIVIIDINNTNDPSLPCIIISYFSSTYFLSSICINAKPGEK